MVVHIWRAPSSLEMNLRNDHQPHGQEKVDEPVDNSAKHARVVLSKVVGTALLVLLLDGGAVVRRQVLGHHVSSLVDQLPEGRGLQWLLALYMYFTL